MTGLLSRVLVPVADDEDADATARALAPYLPEGAAVTAVYVVEKAGGAVDKAGVEQREDHAEEAFEAFRTRLAADAAGATVDTDVLYGTDVVETIFAAADEHDDTAVAFVPREGSRWVRLLTGDLALSLVTENDRPVVALPSPDEALSPETPGGETDADTGDDPDADGSQADTDVADEGQSDDEHPDEGSDPA